MMDDGLVEAFVTAAQRYHAADWERGEALAELRSLVRARGAELTGAELERLTLIAPPDQRRILLD